MMKTTSAWTAGLAAVLLFGVSFNTQATIVGPYSPDASTLHLYHLDSSVVPSVDSAPSGTNLVGLLFGATLGDASFTGFGTCVNTLDGGQDLTAAANKDALITPSVASPPGNVTFPYCNSTNGAFTFEAMVWIGFDPDKNLGTTANGGNNRNAFFQIMSADSTANGSRIFQFRICPKGVAPGGTGNPTIAPQPLLTYENIRTVSANQPTIFATIPTNGPNAILSNAWYHVAVTYNGVPNTADNIKFYWTLLDPSRTSAQQIPITSAQTTLNGPLPLGTAATPFVIGNIGRNVATAGANFLGLIDEVRISNQERRATEMMFNSIEPLVVTQPASQTVAVGDPASLSVLAAGALPLTYQWRHTGTNLPGATLSTFSIAVAQDTDAGSYDVVITNNSGSTTSTLATLSIRVPLNLAWVGSAGALWDTNLVNWDSNGDATADLPFTARDAVTFASAGSAAPTVLITNPVSPRAITVDSATDYTFTTTNNSAIVGASRIRKAGSGTLFIDTDNTFAGPTTIEAGTLQLGVGGARGAIGDGPVTNNGSLVVFRSGAVNFNKTFAGSGTLTNNATNSITISGTNLFSGPITLNSGVLTLPTAQARGASTEYTINAIANSAGPTRMAVGGGMTFGPGTTISLLGSTASPDYRCGLNTVDSTNIFNCAFVLGGSGNVQFGSDGPAASSLFVVSTPQINSPDYTGQLILRGNGNGVFSSKLNINGKLSKTDGGVWIINSTGNSWLASDVAGGRLLMGTHNVFPGSVVLAVTAATAVLDLGGFNQTVDTLTGPGTIANSSTQFDSTITVHPTGLSLFNGVIRDSVAGGTRKVGLTVSSGTFTLSGTNTYTGPTAILAGELELLVDGSISNSATVDIAAGATLNAQSRSDGTFTVAPGQTLRGNGLFNVTGSLVNSGTIRVKVNKSGTTLSNDTLQLTGTLHLGGTLRVDVTASPALTTADSFQIFNAFGGYTGALAEIIPAPGFGLAWDASTLATDGVLRIKTSTVPTTPTTVTATAVGNQIELAWPENYIGWRLQTQANPITLGISTNWVDLVGSSTTNRVFIPVDPAAGSVFYRMVYP